VDCPACGQPTPTLTDPVTDVTYFENHVESLLWSSPPYWVDNDTALFTVSTRLCEGSGREIK
jgi:hypothetical protein